MTLLRSRLQNTAEEWISPATEEKQDSIINALALLLNPSIKFRDVGNSTSTPLDADATFSGAWIDTRGWTAAIITVVTDQDAAEDGLKIESSVDGGVSVLHPHVFSPLANTPYGHHYPTTLDGDYTRVQYTNGPVGQGVFKLVVTLFKNPPEECHVHGVEYAFGSDHPASVTRAITVARNPAGDYINIGCTSGGNQKVSLEEIEEAVAELLNRYPVGTGSNDLLTLTDANTAYAVPPSAPSGSYNITIYNSSDSTLFLGYQNANTNGIPLEPGDTATKDLGASQQLHLYCASAGNTAIYITKLVN